jgi:hypothetical protein
MLLKTLIIKGIKIKAAVCLRLRKIWMFNSCFKKKQGYYSPLHIGVVNYFVTTIFFITEYTSLLTLTKYTPEERSLVEITND